MIVVRGTVTPATLSEVPPQLVGGRWAKRIRKLLLPCPLVRSAHAKRLHPGGARTIVKEVPSATKSPNVRSQNLPEAKSGRWGQGLTKAKMADCRWAPAGYASSREQGHAPARTRMTFRVAVLYATW